MSTIERFEEIRAWQSARKLVIEVYKITNKPAFSKDYALRDQIRRSVGSSVHNIAEGFDSGSTAELVRFLRYALRSASETQSQLYTALDLGYIDEDEFKRIYSKAEETKRFIHGFISYLVTLKSNRKIKEIPEEYVVENDTIQS